MLPGLGRLALAKDNGHRPLERNGVVAPPGKHGNARDCSSITPGGGRCNSGNLSPFPVTFCPTSFLSRATT
jgi:hypothetical protein